MSAPVDERRDVLDRAAVAVGLAAALLLSLAVCLRRVWAADVWWQARTGRFVLEQGWPHLDPFSYVAAAPWIELRWGYCVVQSTLGAALGMPALVIAKWLAVTTAFALAAWPEARRRTAAWIGPVVVVALIVASQRFVVRPELVTFVFVPLYALILDRERRRPGRLVWALPAAQVVWTNMHTLFVLGPLLVGLAFVVSLIEPRLPEGRRTARPRVLGVVLLATAAATLVNPWGLAGATFPLTLFEQIRGTAFKAEITEFRGLFEVSGTFAAVTWSRVLAGACLASALWNLRRLDPFWLLLCASQALLAVLAVRNLPLFALAAVPFVLSNLNRGPWFERAAGRRALRLLGRLAAAAGLLVALRHGVLVATDRLSVAQGDTTQAGLGLARFRYPVEATDYLDRHGIDGRVLGGLLENSYLMAHGRQVFMDPRLEVGGEERFLAFAAANRDPAAFRKVVARHDIRVVLAALRTSLAALAHADPRFRLVWFDDTAVVYLRDDERPDLVELDDAAIDRQAADRLAALPPVRAPGAVPWYRRVSAPRPYVALAELLLLLGRAEAAAPFVAAAETAAPDDPGALLRRATLYEMQGRIPALAGLADTAAPWEVDPRAARRVGLALVRQERLDEARAWLERAVEGDGDRAIVWAALARVRAGTGDLQGAIEAIRRAVELDPGEPAYRFDLARGLARGGRLDEALPLLVGLAAERPDDVAVLRDLAGAAAAAGRDDLARRAVAEGLALAPADPDLRRLAAALGARP